MIDSNPTTNRREAIFEVELLDDWLDDWLDELRSDLLQRSLLLHMHILSLYFAPVIGSKIPLRSPNSGGKVKNGRRVKPGGTVNDVWLKHPRASSMPTSVSKQVSLLRCFWISALVSPLIQRKGFFSFPVSLMQPLLEILPLANTLAHTGLASVHSVSFSSFPPLPTMHLREWADYQKKRQVNK